MSKWTDAGHIDPTGAIFPALIPDADGNLPPAGQRFIQKIMQWGLEAQEAREVAERAAQDEEAMKPEYDMTGTEAEQAEQFTAFIRDRGEAATHALKKIVAAALMDDNDEIEHEMKP